MPAMSAVSLASTVSAVTVMPAMSAVFTVFIVFTVSVMPAVSVAHLPGMLLVFVVLFYLKTVVVFVMVRMSGLIF